MKCYGQILLGTGYSTPEADDYMTFRTVRDAVNKFSRIVRGSDKRYPCVTPSSATMFLWHGEPEGDFPCDMSARLPDVRVDVGPHGGIRKESL